jgi:hypothetical protein
MKQQQSLLPNILICILMDLAGLASFVLPGLGEYFDIIWAPVSGIVFYKMFGGRFGIIGGSLDFLEEIFPFTDFIPTFTIAWMIKYLVQENHSSK